MKTIPYEKFNHGHRVTCEIDGDEITDAKISIERDGKVYICQNVSNGNKATQKFGYMYSWFLLGENVDYTDGIKDVINLQLPKRTLDDLEEGDVIVDEGGVEVKVLGICGKVCFISQYDDFRIVDCTPYTLDELKDDGYTLKQEEEKLEFREPTEEEKKILDNPILKIPADEQTIIYKGKTYILSK